MIQDTRASLTHLVVQNLILRLHARQESILSQVILSTAVLLVSTLNLLIQVLDIGRKQAMELEGCALFVWKGGAFVELARLEKRRSLIRVSASGSSNQKGIKGNDLPRMDI